MSGGGPRPPRSAQFLLRCLLSANRYLDAMRDLDERGMRSVLSEALQKACDGTVGFHLSFDLDGMDPGEVPGSAGARRGPGTVATPAESYRFSKTSDLEQDGVDSSTTGHLPTDTYDRSGYLRVGRG